MKFGKKIYELRKKNNLTQKQFAKKIGCLDIQISHYENDKMVPSIELLIKMSQIFGISVDYLVKDDINDLAKEKIIDLDLLESFKKISLFDDKTKKLIKEIIDSIILKNSIKSMV